MRRNICSAEVRNHIPDRVSECLILRNQSIIVIIFSLIDFKKRLRRRDMDEKFPPFNCPRQGETFHKSSMR
jgi:hypothetical protein